MRYLFRLGSRTEDRCESLRSILLHRGLGERYLNSRLSILDLKILIQNSHNIDLYDLLERLDPDIKTGVDFHVVDRILTISIKDRSIDLNREIAIYREKDLDRLESFLQEIQRRSRTIESLKFYFYIKEDRELFNLINSLFKTYRLDLSTLQFLDIVRNPVNFSFEYKDEELDLSDWLLNPKLVDSIIQNSDSSFRYSYLFSTERQLQVKLPEPINYLYREFRDLFQQDSYNSREKIEKLVNDYYCIYSNLYTIAFENSIILQDILNRSPEDSLQEIFSYSYSNSRTRINEKIDIRLEEKSLILKNIVKSAIQSNYIFSYLKKLSEKELKQLSPILNRRSLDIIESRRQELLQEKSSIVKNM